MGACVCACVRVSAQMCAFVCVNLCYLCACVCVCVCVCVCEVERVRAQLCVFVREFVFACYVISTCASARMREQIFVFVHTNAPTRPHACAHALEHNIANKWTRFARAHVQMQTCMYTWTRTQNRVQLNACARAQIFTFMRAFVPICARTRSCTHANPATTIFCKNAQLCLCSRAHAHVHA